MTAKQQFRRPAAWDRRCSGLPVALAAAQGKISMPPGLWHVSDYAAGHLANPDVRVVAVKHRSGAPFTLLIAPSGHVLAVSAGTDAGLKRIGMDDPTGWARRQTWRIAREGVAP
jgi:hypothetical protein